MRLTRARSPVRSRAVTFLSFFPLPVASDVGRALLQFAEGYPLGKRGLQWLKIHLVNLHGGKKKLEFLITLSVFSVSNLVVLLLGLL